VADVQHTQQLASSFWYLGYVQSRAIQAAGEDHHANSDATNPSGRGPHGQECPVSGPTEPDGSQT
jgi:hypothetical protein